MTTKTKAAWHRCNDNHAFEPKQAAALGRSKPIIPDYERGTMIVGVLFAVLMGMLFIHAAVML